MRRILTATAVTVTALAVAAAGAIAWKALRYRKDAQTWHARWASLHSDPGGTARYRDDNERLRRGGHVANRVVFLGASITEALDLGRLFPNEPLVNRGAGGQLVWQQWLRLDPDALALDPGAVVLKMCAINLLPDAPPLDETRRYYGLMADAVRRRGARVIYATAVPVSRAYDRDEGGGHVTERLTRFNAWVREEARRHDDLVLDYAAVLADPEGYLPEALSDDGLHPNEAGRRRMAEAIRHTVIEGFVHAAPAAGDAAR